MRSTVYVILMVSAVIVNYNTSNAQIHKLNLVKIEFEGFDTETDSDVSCGSFESTFKETKKVRVIIDEQALSGFELLIKNFKQTKTKSLDVRGTITYYYGTMAVKYCFDTFGYFYKDGKCYYNKKLLIHISDKIFTNHPQYLDTLRQQ